jgi:hypothetical protein
VGDGMEGVQGVDGGGKVSTSSWAASFPYTLSVTRLADPSHVGLASVRVVSVGLNTLLCRSTDEREDEENDQERKAWQVRASRWCSKACQFCYMVSPSSIFMHDRNFEGAVDYFGDFLCLRCFTALC